MAHIKIVFKDAGSTHDSGSTHGERDSLTLTARVGETVFEALNRLGIMHNSPCGGAGICKKCKIICEGEIAPIQKNEWEFLSDEELLHGVRFACMAKIAGDCTVYPDEIILTPKADFSPVQNESSRSGHGIAVDIGTTTVAVYLYDLSSAQMLGVLSMQNRQRSMGDDVISRIAYTEREGGLDQLSSLIRQQLNEMIHTLCVKNAVETDEITFTCVAGNTTMLHLLCALDPSKMATAPFTPMSLFGNFYRAGQLGLELKCDVFLTPCVSAYVGGDITAGIAACGLDQSDGVNIFIDIGTNGEMALCKNGDIFCCSVAAGPAFEGARIKHGCAGTRGAINSARLDENGKIVLSTISNAPPIGICGSGLIDAAALMLCVGALDETGFLAEDFYLDEARSIAVTPHDIRELQLAKSAVCAGVERLMQLSHTDYNEIDALYLAGGFGSAVNVESAAAIGLFPRELKSKCRFAGNAAGQGAVYALLNQDFCERLIKLPEKCLYTELSGDADFADLFIDNMEFKGE